MNETQTLDLQCLTKAHYLLQKGDPEARVYILFHGYTENAEVMWRRFQKRFPENTNIISLSGPFPIPKKVGEGYVMGFSWYFYDFKTGTYFIHYDVCTDYVTKVVNALGFKENKKTLIGFSQGGYAIPHLAEKLENTDHLIGLGCQFIIENPQWPEGLKLDALHGDQDQSVELARAQKLFAQLPEKHQGEFEIFPGVAHGPSNEMLHSATQKAVTHL